MSKQRGYELTQSEHSQNVLHIHKLNLFSDGQSVYFPIRWLSTITFGSGKPNAMACLILADILYWYRPILTRDEDTGSLLPPRKKFKGNILQKSYLQLANTFGITKIEAKRYCRRLEELNLIKLHFETIRTNGVLMNNVMHIEIHPNQISEITFNLPNPDPLCTQKFIGLCTSDDRAYELESTEPMDLKVHTNTKSTTKNNTEITIIDPTKEIQTAQPPQNNNNNPLIETDQTSQVPTPRQAIQKAHNSHKPAQPSTKTRPKPKQAKETEQPPTKLETARSHMDEIARITNSLAGDGINSDIVNRATELMRANGGDAEAALTVVRSINEHYRNMITTRQTSTDKKDVRDAIIEHGFNSILEAFKSASRNRGRGKSISWSYISKSLKNGANLQSGDTEKKKRDPKVVYTNFLKFTDPEAALEFTRDTTKIPDWLPAS